MSPMTKLPIKGLPANDTGRLLTRLNYKHRVEVPRYGIVRLKNIENGKTIKTLVLGHDDDTAIFIPYDVRKGLGAVKGAQLNFSIQKVGWIGKLSWLLGSPDPAIHMPSWIAILSVALGALGVINSLYN